MDDKFAASRFIEVSSTVLPLPGSRSPVQHQRNGNTPARNEYRQVLPVFTDHLLKGHMLR